MTAAGDSFTTERNAFVYQWDRLKMADRKTFADFPNPSSVRVVASMAAKFALQDNNPFRNFTPADMWALSLANSFIRWTGDPGNPQRWREMFNCRVELGIEWQ